MEKLRTRRTSTATKPRASALGHEDRSAPADLTRDDLAAIAGRLSPASATPLLVQLADAIRQLIADGIWRAGKQLPSEPDLANAVGVSRGTVRRAFQSLIADGLITQAHGKGTFVGGTPSRWQASATMTPGGRGRQMASTTELRVLVPGTLGAAEATPYRAIGSAFEAAHPDVRVIFEPTTGNLPELPLFYERRISQGDDTIDILTVDYMSVVDLADRGLLIPLEDLAGWGIVDGFVESARLAGMVGDRFFAAPRESSSVYLFVNRTLLSAAGVEPPVGIRDAPVEAVISGRWTFEQVADAARLVVAANPEVLGFRIEGWDNIYCWQALAASLGGIPLSPDGTTATGYLDSDAWITATEWYQELILDGIVSIAAPPWTNEPFIRGEEALFLGLAMNAGPLLGVSFENDVAAHPRFAAGVPASPTDAWQLGVSARSKQKDLAAELIRFWTLDPRGQDVWAELGGLAASSYLAVKQRSRTPPYDKYPLSLLQIGIYQAQHDAIHRPHSRASVVLDVAFSKAMRRIVRGGDARIALREAAHEYDEAVRVSTSTRKMILP